MRSKMSPRVKKKLAQMKRVVAKEPVLFPRLAALYIEAGDARSAAKVLSQGLSRYPNSLSGWLVKGYFHLWQRQLSLARSAFQRATQLDVRIPGAYYQLAEIAREEGDRNAAIGYLKMLTALAALDESSQMMIHTLLLRQVAVESGLLKPDEAERMMPGALRSLLLQKGLLPPELQRRTLRVSTPISTPPPPSPAPPEKGFSESSPGYPPLREEATVPSPERQRDEDELVQSEIEEEGEEEVPRVSWVDAIAGETSRAIFTVPSEAEGKELSEEEGEPGDGERVEVGAEEEEEFKVWKETEWEVERGKEIGEEEGVFEEEEASPRGEEQYPSSPALRENGVYEEKELGLKEELTLSEEENYPREGEKLSEREIITYYERQSPPISSPPLSPPSVHSVGSEYWAEVPDPAVTRPKDETPIIRLLTMKREDVQRLIERGEVTTPEREGGTHFKTAKVKMESPLETLMGGEYSSSEPPSATPTEPSLPSAQEGDIGGPSVAFESEAGGEESEVRGERESGVKKGEASGISSTVELIKGEVSPGDKLSDKEEVMPNREEPSPSSVTLPPELQAQQEEARQRLKEVAQKVTSRKKSPSSNVVTPPSEKPKIATKTLAELYASQGDWGRAAEVYRELLQRFPDNQAYRRRLEEIMAKITEGEES